MAPIFTPDGAEVEEVILPDGSAAAEVIAPDGTVVFDGIPDDRIHQWEYTEGAGTETADVIGSLDLDYTGLDWGSGAGEGDTFGILNGSSDYAAVDPDEFASLREQSTGTFVFWLNPDGGSGDQWVTASENTTSGTNYALGFRGLNDINWRLTNNGDTSVVLTGAPPSNEWVALAGVADDENNELVLYIAEPPDYDVVVVGTATTPQTTTNNWSETPTFGARQGTDSQLYSGGIDLSFYADEAWTQDELQAFVDDSKGLYE